MLLFYILKFIKRKDKKMNETEIKEWFSKKIKNADEEKTHFLLKISERTSELKFNKKLSQLETKQIKEILNSVGVANYYAKNKDLKEKLKKESSDKMFINNFEWSKDFKFKNLTFLENGIWFDKRFMAGGEETVEYLKTLNPTEVTFAEVIGSELVLS